MNEATAGIKIHKLLERVGWPFSPEEEQKASIRLEQGGSIKQVDFDLLGYDFEKTRGRLIDFPLLDTKSEEKRPLAGIQHARRNARAQHCQFYRFAQNGKIPVSMVGKPMAVPAREDRPLDRTSACRSLSGETVLMAMMEGIRVKYPHLSLVEWPFQTTPDQNFYTFMADRAQVKDDLGGILRSLSRRNTSTIHLMWSWYGAGKTHTLRHIEYMCRNEYTGILPIYTEMPKSLKNFCDMYRSFAAALDFELARNCFLEVVTSPIKETMNKELRTMSLDMFNALSTLCTGTDRQQDVVLRWLRGETLTLGEIRPLGIGKRITSAEDAIRAVSWIVRLFNAGASLSEQGTGRVVWMIDEFQQVGQSKPVAREVNNCLHSIFNRCPNSLSLFISFSGRPEKGYPPWLSPELADRIGVQKVVVLPPLTRSEAKGFVRDVLDHFRPANPTTGDAGFFPFQEGTVDLLLELIEKDRHEIRPRSIMQYFTSVLEVAEPMVEEGELKEIGEKFARDCLKDRLLEEPTQ